MKLQLSLRLVLRRFLLIFLPLLTLASVIAMLFYYLEAKNAKEERFIFETSEVNYVKLQMQTIINDFKMIKSDLAILTSHHEMHKHHEGGEFHRKKALAEEFLLFCDKKGIYDQVRLLDEKGKEIVRVNYNSGNPYIVPEDQLQFKGDRYYFKDTFKLDEDEMFISPFDLNIEGGRIEKPLKPMLRFGTTVFDRYGQKRGIVVLNYLGENLINALKLVSVSAPGHIMLLNSDGYWLRGAKPEDEWGFMYESRKNVNFGNDFPNAWQLIAVGESGHFYNKNGLFTFMTVYLFLEGWKSTSGSGSTFEESVKDLQAKEYTWKIVSHIVPDVLSVRLGSFTTILFSIYGAVIASIGCGSWFLANLSVRRMIAEEEVKALNESLEQRVVERTTVLEQRNIELKLIEGILRESEEKFRKITSSAFDAIVMMDDKGEISFWNEAAERMFGYSKEEVVGKDLHKLIIPERYYGNYLKGMEGFKEDGTGLIINKTFILPSLRKDGPEFFTDHSFSSVKIKNKWHVISIIRDITGRKLAEIHEKRSIFTAYFSRSCRDFVELKPVTELATKGLTEQLNIQRASVWLLDDSNNLVCQKLYEHSKGSFSEGTVLSRERYPDYKRAILNDNPIDAHNARTDPRTKKFLNDYLLPLNIYSMLDTPIKLKGKVSGVLCLEQTEHIRHWQKDEIDFVNTITAQLSSAIDRITERKQTERLLNAQRSITKVLSESTTLKEASPRILSSMCTVLEWDLGEIWIFDPKNNELRCSEIWHVPSVEVSEYKAVTRHITFSPGIGLPGSVLSSVKPVWIADVVHEKNFPRASVAAKAGLHGAFGFPILVGREVLGTISLYSREIKQPDKNLLDMLTAIGFQIGLFIRRKRADEQIKVSLKEKEVLLNEIHHRVKNNLQIISSLLDLSSMQTQNQETIELFAESRNRVDSMALIHSQLYKSERFDEIDMERHIQELSRNLLNIYSKEKTITLNVKSANVYLPVTRAVPCALVLNELISNSLKHAYRDGEQGTISISMQQSDDDTILMRVRDNGAGIPEEIDIGRTKSLGLKLARNIVNKQLNGKIKIIRNKGTEFIVEFKNSKEDS